MKFKPLLKNTVLQLALGLVFLAYLPVQAQYRSLFNEQGTSWKFSVRDPEFGQYLYDSMYVNGDTIINNIAYKILSDSSYTNESSPYTHGTYGFAREDTVAGRAWSWLTSNQYYEREIYNISLAVGDSFNINAYNSSSYYVFVDSVYYLNNRKHVRFNYTLGSYGRPYPQKLTFIEGIGPNSGFEFNDILDQFSDMLLLCAYRNQTQVFQQAYQQAGYIGCKYYRPAATPEELAQSQVILSPNPASTSITLTLKDGLPPVSGSVQILDLLGRVVKTENWAQGQPTATINLHEPRAGVYITSLLQNGQVKWRQRLVVQP